MADSVIHIKNLHKYYGNTKAVDDISFEVRRGEIFGLVGPNGAGKTTTIECIEGLRKPDSGNLKVLGLNPSGNSRLLKKSIGIQMQESELPDRIKVWEAIDLFSSFYNKTIKHDSLLKELGINDKKGAYFGRLSGGQKQRLFIALSLINDPELVFLDELTTGLDPQARRTAWELIKSINKKGKTIFLTTHYMEEAEKLCDRVGVIDHGKLVALDTPQKLISKIKAENRLIFSVAGTLDINKLKGMKSISNLEEVGGKITVYGHDKRMVKDVVNFLVNNDIDFYDLRTEQATLEDTFLALTGKQIRN